MKLSKLAKICKDCNQIHIIDTYNGDELTQWAGDGSAFYELAGMPEFTAETLFVSLGFDLSKKDCWIMSRREEKDELPVINLAVEDDTDLEAHIEQFGSVSYRGTDYVIVYAGGKMYFFNRKYFAPLKMDENFNTVLRGSGAKKYLITKDGLFPTALIAPAQISDDMKAFLKMLGMKAE